MGDVVEFPAVFKDVADPEALGHPFEIISSVGDRTFADDEAGALTAAYQMQRDHVGNSNLIAPSVSIFYEGTLMLVVNRALTFADTYAGGAR